MMGKRLFWVDDNAIHNGPDHEGYWLIDGGGYEATEPLYIIDRMRLAELKAIPYPLVPEALTMLDEERVLIRVWPKEDDDESH